MPSRSTVIASVLSLALLGGPAHAWADESAAVEAHAASEPAAAAASAEGDEVTQCAPAQPYGGPSESQSPGALGLPGAPTVVEEETGAPAVDAARGALDSTATATPGTVAAAAERVAGAVPGSSATVPSSRRTNPGATRPAPATSVPEAGRAPTQGAVAGPSSPATAASRRAARRASVERAATPAARSAARRAARAAPTAVAAGTPAPEATVRADIVAQGALDVTDPVSEAGLGRSVVRIVERIPAWLLGLLGVSALTSAGLLAGLVREHGRAERARRRAMVDCLTGLPNRLAFEDRAAAEWDRAERYERPMGMLLLDLDGFKQLNDTRGHAAGDRALRKVAEALQARVRVSDLAARIGGDEFALLVPETQPEGLEALARAVEGMAHDLPVGISAGWAARETEDEGWAEVLARADDAMYERKRERRDVRPARKLALVGAPA